MIENNYEDISIKIDDILLKDLPASEKLEKVMELLHMSISDFDWVGLYLMRGGKLVIGPYSGPPTPHTEIEISEGICGASFRERRTIAVSDVSTDERFLACSLTTKSEVVVPIFDSDEVIAEIDVDSDTPDAFSDDCISFLERLAETLQPHIKELI